MGDRLRLRAASVGLAVALAGGAMAAATSNPPAAAAGVHVPRFPDFGQLIPPGEYNGRTFKLSQDYPTSRPELDPEIRRILSIDYHQNWRAYADAVMDYVLEGNVENRDVSQAFYLEDNKVRRWYHVPWQHWGDAGREGIHGLTSEGPAFPGVLGPDQTGPEIQQTYAVGFYNAPGGYMVGKVWKDAENPDLDAVRREGGFPIGTVVGKILFTTATPEQAHYLTNPIEWRAYIKPKFSFPPSNGLPVTPRELGTVRLIQMDIMVRDDRAKDTGGWVFGTYVYNGARAQPNKWRNLTPVGLMWGNDPGVESFPQGNPAPQGKTPTNPDLKHSVINAADPRLPPNHLGYGLRLNGPVDDTLSSCKSCHQTAQFPMVSPILPALAQKNGCPLKASDAEWQRWFRDLGPTDSFDTGTYPMDNSLQLAASIQNFLSAKTQQTGGRYNVEYYRGQPAAQSFGVRGLSPEAYKELCTSQTQK